MERLTITQEASREVSKTRGFRIPRWGLAVILVSSLVVACGSNPVPTLAIVRNEPNAQGDYGSSAKPGTCAPLDTPNWIKHRQLEFRCVDPSGDFLRELRINVKKTDGEDISVTIHRPVDSESGNVLTVPHGQTINGIQNPVNGNCFFEVVNKGKQPRVDEACY